MSSLSPAASSVRAGALAATGAFLLWGIAPVYWKPLQGYSPYELIAHRSTWALFLLLALLGWQGNFASVRPAFASLRAVGLTLCSSVLLAANWTMFVWAVNSGHVIESSLGYFLVPLVNVALGSLLLHERLRRLQWLAIACAAAGVAVLLLRAGRFPWIALSLAGTWAAYGLLKKRSALGSIAGLTAETLTLLPLAAGWLLWLGWQGGGILGHADFRIQGYVFCSGLITSIPLLLFAYGAQRLRLTTLGLFQYLGPTVQFLLGLLLYHEPFDRIRFQAFGLIWVGLMIYSADMVWSQRGRLRPVGAAG